MDLHLSLSQQNTNLLDVSNDLNVSVFLYNNEYSHYLNSQDDKEHQTSMYDGEKATILHHYNHDYLETYKTVSYI